MPAPLLFAGGIRVSFFPEFGAAMGDVLKTFVVAALLVAWAAEPGHAEDSAKQFAVHGIGAKTCSQVTASVQKDAMLAHILASWVSGYLSAINRTAHDRYDVSPIVDPGGLVGLVYNGCVNNPDLTVQDVAASLFEMLAKAGVRAASPMVEAKAAGKTVEIRAETLVSIQTALAALGRYDAKPDGMFGPKMEAALRSYQNAEKLPETGLPDAPTIFRLLVEQKPAEKAKK